MKKTPIFLLLAISFSACYNPKEPQPDKFHLTGRVLAYGTNEPVAGAFVWASQCEGGQILGAPCQDRIVATDTTDVQGHYEFDATGFALDVGASKANYDSRNTQKQVNGSGGEKVIDIVIRPDAWLDITIKHTSAALSLDFALNYTKRFILPKDSTARVFSKVGGNGNRIIELGVHTADGKFISRNDTVYCPGLDTIFHYIEY